MVSKKGQGLSLNVIIVAAIALVVLVVLIMIFTGRIGIFESTIGGEAKSELQVMKTFYGDCQPNALAETGFLTEYNAAANIDDTQESTQGKAEAKTGFQGEINRCKTDNTNKDDCDADTYCTWR